MNLAVPPLDPDHAPHSGPRRPAAAPTHAGPSASRVPSPSARISRRGLEAGPGAPFTIAGAVGAYDAAVLSRCLHTELDERAEAAPGPGRAVIVVDLTASLAGRTCTWSGSSRWP